MNLLKLQGTYDIKFLKITKLVSNLWKYYNKQKLVEHLNPCLIEDID